MPIKQHSNTFVASWPTLQRITDVNIIRNRSDTANVAICSFELAAGPSGACQPLHETKA
jgi:hypothetical protein